MSDPHNLERFVEAQNAHGTYTAVAMLPTDTHPVERRIAFTLP